VLGIDDLLLQNCSQTVIIFFLSNYILLDCYLCTITYIYIIFSNLYLCLSYGKILQLDPSPPFANVVEQVNDELY
jgi:hypothetical protein